jgi:hypothetical protein
VFSLRYEMNFKYYLEINDRLCGLVVRVPCYRFRGPCSIPGSTKCSAKYWVWNESTQPREYN